MKDAISKRMQEAITLAGELYKKNLSSSGGISNVGFYGGTGKDPAIAILATKIYDELKEGETKWGGKTT